MKKILVVFMVLAVLTSSDLFAQQKLSLEKAISIALQRNSSLIKTKNSINTFEANVKSSYGDLLPDFGLRGSWNWSKTQDDGGTQLDFFGNPQVIPASENDSRSYSVSAGGSVLLFNGLANYANIDQKENNLEGAKLNLSKLKQDIVYTASELFYNIIAAQKLLAVRKENVEYNQKLLETIEERNNLGAVAVADVYAQQVQLGNSELSLIQAENQLENAKSLLLNYLALDVLENYEFLEPTEMLVEMGEEYSMNELPTLVNEALKGRYDYQSKKLDVEAASNGVTMSRSGYWPSISGNYGFSTSATAPGNLFDRKIYSAGLSLNVPIFSGFSTEASVEAAMVSEKNQLEDLLALERSIKIDVKQGLLDYSAAKKEVEVAKKNVLSAEESRKINNEKYNLGAGTILEVLQSVRDFTEARRQLISAEFSYNVAMNQLLNSLGKLDFAKFE